MAFAEAVGEASQPAIPKRTPTMITVVAMLVISEEAIDQVASAAGLALWSVTSSPTTMPPAISRATITAKPAAIRPMPAVEHRHPAFLLREVDREAEGEQGEQGEDQRQPLDRDRDVLRRLQVVGLEDRDLPRVGWEFLRQVGSDADLAGEVGDQAAEVEADVRLRRSRPLRPCPRGPRSAARGRSCSRLPRGPSRSRFPAAFRRRSRRRSAGRRRAGRRTPWFPRGGCPPVPA